MRQEINLLRHYKIKIFIFLIPILFTDIFSTHKCYSQEYELPESAISVFIQGKGNLNVSVKEFVKLNGGKPITMENKKWCPSHEYYIEWRYLQLRYWFIVSDSKKFDKYIYDFESMVSYPDFDEFRKYGYVKTSTKQTDFPSGCIEEGELMSSKFIQAKVSIDANALIVFRNDLQNSFAKWQAKQKVSAEYSPFSESDDFENSKKEIGKFQKEMQTRLQGREIREKLNKLKNKYYAQAGLDINSENLVNGGQPTETGKENLTVNPSDVLKQYGVNFPNTSNGKDAITKNGKQGPNGNSKSTQNGNPNGKENSDGGGDGNNKKTWLPIKVSFSDWFGHLLEIVTEYFGIDGITKQMLSVAYFIAPQLFDEVGSFFAKIQHSLTPKSLDDFLNSVSDIVEHLHKFYRCATAIKNMFADPEFQALFKGDMSLNNLPVDKIIQGIEKGSTLGNQVGLISGENLKTIQAITGYGKLLSEGDIAINLSNFAYKNAKHFLLKTKIGSKLPFAEMEKCYSNPNKSECLKILTHGAIMNLPNQYSKYGSALDNLVIKGDFKAAAKEAAMQEINRIPIEYRDDVKKIIDGTATFSKADLLRISKNVLKSTGNKELADLILAGRGMNFVSDYVDNNANNIKKEVANILSSMNLSEESIAEFLTQEKPELLKIMAKGFGFSDTEAQSLFVSGDINGAIKKQIEKGVPVRNWAYYQQFGQEIRNKTVSRIGIYQVMIEAMKQGYMPYNFTRLIQSSK